MANTNKANNVDRLLEEAGLDKEEKKTPLPSQANSTEDAIQELEKDFEEQSAEKKSLKDRLKAMAKNPKQVLVASGVVGVVGTLAVLIIAATRSKNSDELEESTDAETEDVKTEEV